MVSSVGDTNYSFSKKEFEPEKEYTIDDAINESSKTLKDDVVIKESFKLGLTLKQTVEWWKQTIDDEFERVGITKDMLVECKSYKNLIKRINELGKQGIELREEYSKFNDQLETYIADIEAGKKVSLNKVEEWLVSKKVLKFFYKSPMKKYVGLWAVEQSQSRLAEIYRLISTDETASAMSLKRKIDRILPKSLFTDKNQKTPRSLKKRMDKISLPTVIESDIFKSLNSSTPAEIANSLKVIEEMTEPGEARTKLIIQWVNQQKIPLARLNLSKVGLYGIVLSKQFKEGNSLTHIDLRGCFEKETWSNEEKEALLDSIEPKYVKSLFIDNRTDLMEALPAELSRFLPVSDLTFAFMRTKAIALGMNAEGAAGFHVLADWINQQKIPLKDLLFTKTQIQQIFPLLQHADLEECVAEFDGEELLSLINSAADNLVYLKVRSLELNSLPESFPKLKYLDISGSGVQELPQNCPELTEFHCYPSESLNSIPLQYLRHLTANTPEEGEATLASIFAEFRKLDLESNSNETIKFIADWINEKKIPLINLTMSKGFKYIIENEAVKFGSVLQHLDLTKFFDETNDYAREGLTNTMISGLLEHAAPSLRFLKLDTESPIRVLPEEFSELRILECHSPNLRVLPKKCSKLVQLDCSNSRLIRDLPHAPKLEKLMCDGCTQLTVRQIYPRVDSAQMRKILGKK